ncbi:SIR2 family NAD-dependent protein deacylase [Roseibium sp. SCP14]|uniref:SIR2 family NAD-dependent protein deacylase n=1 Tax=Roseibium sp. SCP14 TaxID=3141375 RepID=UPI0033390F86
MTTIEQAREVVHCADAILIGAGAGLSASAGLDYTDQEAFAERFPGMLQYHARCQYQLMGYPFPDEALKWGYLSVALDHVYQAGQTQVYQDLLSLIGERDYFVITSNVDRYFHKNGFNPDRIYTPQGDYERFQCMTPCGDQVWDGRPSVAEMLPHVDRTTQLVTDRSTLPVCPNCGGPVFMNVRGGNWFIEHPYKAEADAINTWLSENQNKTLAILEIGAGFNTPGVIRLPMEAVATQFPKATLIRVSKEHPQGPKGTISIQLPAHDTLSKLVG